MSENRLIGRIVNKHDVQANWEKATNFTPMLGEIIVYDVDENFAYERFKIGDGQQNVNALPFADAATLVEAKAYADAAIAAAIQFATDDEILEMMASIDALPVLADENDTIYTDDADNILLI